MTKPPKIMIQKKVTLNDKGHFRFYSPYYTKRREKRPSVLLNLADTVEYNPKGHRYPNAKFHTEKQLVKFLRDNFGYGDYLVLGFQKGHSGPFVFWKGSITEEGWIFLPQGYNKKDVQEYQKWMEEAETEEDRLELESEMFKLKEIEKEIKSHKRYGFAGTMKSSGKRGIFHMWEEPDEGIVKPSTIPEQPKVKKKFEEMNLDDINQF